MQESQKGRELHQMAVEAVEFNQDFISALNLINEAQDAYVSSEDCFGASEVQGYRSLVYRHLHDKSRDRAYLILAKEAASSVVELAKLTDDESALALPHRDLGQAYAELEDWTQAVDNLEKSLKIFEQNPPERHNKDSVRAEVKGRLAFAVYKNGDKERGRQLFGEAVEVLQGTPRDYETDVWLSGVHMGAAEALASDDKEGAKEHLNKAKEIIDSDEKLEIRREQWKELSGKLAS